MKFTSTYEGELRANDDYRREGVIAHEANDGLLSTRLGPCGHRRPSAARRRTTAIRVGAH
jgi:hypothetical protein